MKLPVTRIQAQNFRSLARVDLRLGPLNVLIGPNGSGKTNVLNVLRFLAVQASDWGPGELWFSGVIRGVPA